MGITHLRDFKGLFLRCPI